MAGDRISELEEAARQYALDHADLVERVRTLEAQLGALQRQVRILGSSLGTAAAVYQAALNPGAVPGASDGDGSER